MVMSIVIVVILHKFFVLQVSIFLLDGVELISQSDVILVSLLNLEDFSFQLYPDDLERLEFYIEDAMARVPLLETAGINRNINGPIPYAPDGLPMVGPMPGVKNAFEAHSFTFGIAQGGGAGKVMAEWIMHGETELDMWSVWIE